TLADVLYKHETGFLSVRGNIVARHLHRENRPILALVASFDIGHAILSQAFPHGPPGFRWEFRIELPHIPAYQLIACVTEAPAGMIIGIHNHAVRTQAIKRSGAFFNSSLHEAQFLFNFSALGNVAYKSAVVLLTVALDIV